MPELWAVQRRGYEACQANRDDMFDILIALFLYLSHAAILVVDHCPEKASDGFFIPLRRAYETFPGLSA